MATLKAIIFGTTSVVVLYLFVLMMTASASRNTKGDILAAELPSLSSYDANTMKVAVPEVPPLEKEIAGGPLLGSPVQENIVGGHRSLYRKPHPSLQISGVVALFHGCGHDPDDWFRLPEDRDIVREINKLGLVAIALCSADRQAGRCWHNDETEISHVEASLLDILSRESWTALPRYALGASSGGTFVSVLTAKLVFNAQAIYISPGQTGVFTAESPDTVFVYMPRDVTWASTSNIEQQMLQLQQLGKKTTSFQQRERPIHPDTFHQRFTEISENESQRLYDKLRELNFIDNQGVFQVTPRRIPGSVGQNILKANTSLFKNFAFLEICNVHYGQHELSAEYITEVLIWLTKT